MTRIFDIVPGAIWALIVGVLLAFGVAQTLRLSASKSETAAEKVTAAGLRLAAAEQRARVATLTLKASEDARKIEATKIAHAKEIVHVVEIEKSKTVAAVARDRADVVRLRSQLAAYAAGTGGASGSAAAAGAGLSAGQRAEALGLVSATCADEAVSDAGELENFAGQVRGLHGYWGLTGDHP